ncbi:MAG: Methylglyoxal synthase [Firmicutes bacterium]|nr:Methylglyoxal synthase [candidate division NPL-UPA2 bacterium]
MRIALVAHDQKKDVMIKLAREHHAFLNAQLLVATATTGAQLSALTGLTVTQVLSGPQGGDAQISAMVATGQIDVVIFLRDPLTAQPHEPDITALLRICDVHDVPLATNLGTARALLAACSQLPGSCGCA